MTLHIANAIISLTLLKGEVVKVIVGVTLVAITITILCVLRARKKRIAFEQVDADFGTLRTIIERVRKDDEDAHRLLASPYWARFIEKHCVSQDRRIIADARDQAYRKRHWENLAALFEVWRTGTNIEKLETLFVQYQSILDILRPMSPANLTLAEQQFGFSFLNLRAQITPLFEACAGELLVSIRMDFSRESYETYARIVKASEQHLFMKPLKLPEDWRELGKLVQ